MSDLDILTMGEERYGKMLALFEEFAIQIVKATAGPLRGANVVQAFEVPEYFDIIAIGRRFRVACSMPLLGSTRGTLMCYSFQLFSDEIDVKVAEIQFGNDGEVLAGGNVESMKTIDGAANILAAMLVPYLKLISRPDAIDAIDAIQAIDA